MPFDSWKGPGPALALRAKSAIMRASLHAPLYQSPKRLVQLHITLFSTTL